MARTIPKLKIEGLFMRRVRFEADHLIYALQNSNRLRVLGLEDIDLATSPQVIERLVCSISDNLQQLSIVRCKIGDTFLKILSENFVVTAQNLMCLDLSGNQFKNIRPLLNALTSKTGFSLVLDNCGLQALQCTLLQNFINDNQASIASVSAKGNKCDLQLQLNESG